MSSCFFSSRLKIRISAISESKKRPNTALPNEPVPPVINKVLFKNIYIPSAGYDAGTSIGSALYLYNQILGKERLEETTSAFFGKKATHKEIITSLDERNVSYSILSDDESGSITLFSLSKGKEYRSLFLPFFLVYAPTKSAKNCKS